MLSRKEQGRLSDGIKTCEAGAQALGRRGSRLVSQARYVAGFTLYSESQEKPLEGGKQGRDMLSFARSL